MGTTQEAFETLTADDLMSRDLVQIPQNTPMADAARLLLGSRVSGAPVVDEEGRCVGVLSAADFLHVAQQEAAAESRARRLPLTCGFQQKGRTPAGEEVAFCKLPPHVCPLQRLVNWTDGEKRVVCCEPHCVPTDWQVVLLDQLPGDTVRGHMTADVVTANSNMRIGELARRMVDAHVHRLVVVDAAGRPIGIVSSTDILAAVASTDWPP